MHTACLTGLGETCSHVASLLWSVEAGVRLLDSLTVMQKEAYWVLPPSVKDMPYASLSEIQFENSCQLRLRINYCLIIENQ